MFLTMNVNIFSFQACFIFIYREYDGILWKYENILPFFYWGIWQGIY
jgi:hypothetical protein